MMLRRLLALFGMLALASCGSVEEPTVHVPLSKLVFVGSVQVGTPMLLYALPVSAADTDAVPVQINITGNPPFVVTLHPRWNGLPDDQLAAVINSGACCARGAAFIHIKEAGAPGGPGQPVSNSTFTADSVWLGSRMTIVDTYRPFSQFDVRMAATSQLVHDIRALPTLARFEPVQLDPFYDPAHTIDSWPLLAVVFTDSVHGVHAVAGDTLTAVYIQPDGSTLASYGRIFY